MRCPGRSTGFRKTAHRYSSVFFRLFGRLFDRPSSTERTIVRLLTIERPFVSQHWMTSTASSAADMAALSTRERILAEALQLFAESGYGGASMRELARRVGVRESSLYNHFAGKAAILEAIVSAYGPASSASRLGEPRYRQLSRQPAAFCRQFALDLVAQWSDPREHQFQKVITAERNRVPGIRAKFADQFYSREQRLMTDYFRGFALAGLISTNDPREDGADAVGRPDLHPPRTLRRWAPSRRRTPRSSRPSIASSHSSCHCWRQRTLPNLIQPKPDRTATKQKTAKRERRG